MEDWTVAAVQEIGCPEKFTTMRKVSDTFCITNGVKQGCVLAPKLSSIFLSAMLEEAFRDMGDSVYIQSRQNADFFTVVQSEVNHEDQMATQSD